jgi:PAS domain-containing protein
LVRGSLAANQRSLCSCPNRPESLISGGIFYDTAGISRYVAYVAATCTDNYYSSYPCRDNRSDNLQKLLPVTSNDEIGLLISSFNTLLTEQSVLVQQQLETEEALKKSELLYRAVVEDQTEAIIRYRPDGTYTYVNDVFCRTFGKQSQEIIGTNWSPEAYPDDIPNNATRSNFPK